MARDEDEGWYCSRLHEHSTVSIYTLLWYLSCCDTQICMLLGSSGKGSFLSGYVYNAVVT